jgi:putative chitinase
MSLIKFQQKIGATPDGDFGKGTLTKGLEFFKMTPERAAHFFGQTAHETGGFTVFTENLNYSAQGLQATFGKYFPGNLEESYAKNPEKIASRVYADRMGNGNEASGDGFKYRGRGLIQLTGKTNYTWFAASLEITPEEAAEYMGTFEGAAQSACWFWETNKLNQWADKGDIEKMTKIINGGTIGLEDRKKHYAHALHVLGA